MADWRTELCSTGIQQSKTTVPPAGIGTDLMKSVCTALLLPGGLISCGDQAKSAPLGVLVTTWQEVDEDVLLSMYRTSPPATEAAPSGSIPQNTLSAFVLLVLYSFKSPYHAIP